MATVKKTSGNLIIQTPRAATSNITLDTDTVYITGNLTITGDTFYSNVTNSDIKDRLIVLNYGETGSGVAGGTGTAGIIIDRGTRANVRLQWQEGANVWQISDYTGIAFGTILTSPLIANLNTSTYALTSTTNIVLGGNLQLNNPSTAPTSAVANATVVYGGTPSGGTAGVYVLNGTAANQELITKARAFGFSLIL
jgi:hypothetical protein